MSAGDEANIVFQVPVINAVLLRVTYKRSNSDGIKWSPFLAPFSLAQIPEYDKS
jgi:hypothetical protein